MCGFDLTVGTSMVQRGIGTISLCRDGAPHPPFLGGTRSLPGSSQYYTASCPTSTTIILCSRESGYILLVVRSQAHDD
jgi:hypothetical protein